MRGAWLVPLLGLDAYPILYRGNRPPRSGTLYGLALTPSGTDLFAGSALGALSYRFASDPFYANGFIPTVRQLVERLQTGN